MYAITLRGACPSKKNNYAKGRRAFFIKPEIRQQINALQFQAQALWKLPPLLHPTLSVTFYVSTNRIDRDGMLTTVLDILQAADVLENDNVFSCNGKLTLEPAVLVNQGEEKVVIVID